VQRGLNWATLLTGDPKQGKQLLQFALDEKLLHMTKVFDPERGEDIIFLGRPRPITGIQREVEPWVPDARITEYQSRVLNILQSVEYGIDTRVLAFVEANREVWKYMDGDREADKIGYIMKAIKEYMAKYPDGIFRQRADTPDGRRYYMTSNALSHQGNDVQRGIVHFARSSKVKNRTAIHEIADILNQEYGVGMHNYRQIVEDPSLCFTDECGLKGKKPVCTYAAALCISDLMATGESKYIVQQDQTCSGFQHWSMELGCNTLGILTNLIGGDRQDLYTVTATMVKMFMVGDYEYWYDRSSGKFFVLRIGYGAAAKSLSRGLILAKGQDDDFQYVDGDGAYIPGSLESLDIARFNEDHYEYFKNFGPWSESTKHALAVSRAYYSSLMNLSPKLQAALTMCKKANAAALANGEFMQWTLPNGDVRVNCGWKPDPNADKVRVSMRNQDDTKFQFTYMPMIKDGPASAVAPTMIHSADGLQMGEIIIESYEEYMEPIAPIHDSTGASVAHYNKIGGMWKSTAERLWLNREESMFFETMRKYGIQIPKKLWPTGWVPLDISNAKYHLG